MNVAAASAKAPPSGSTPAPLAKTRFDWIPLLLVAAVMLAGSGLCGLAAPWMLDAPLAVWAVWLLLWGATVAGDSPQFSALSAKAAPDGTVGHDPVTDGG